MAKLVPSSYQPASSGDDAAVDLGLGDDDQAIGPNKEYAEWDLALSFPVSPHGIRGGKGRQYGVEQFVTVMTGLYTVEDDTSATASRVMLNKNKCVFKTDSCFWQSSKFRRYMNSELCHDDARHHWQMAKIGFVYLMKAARELPRPAIRKERQSSGGIRQRFHGAKAALEGGSAMQEIAFEASQGGLTEDEEETRNACRALLEKQMASGWEMGYAADPLLRSRNYLGEENAFLFGFYSTFTFSLIVPAVVGLVLMIVAWTTGTNARTGTDDTMRMVEYSTHAYGVFLVVWAMIFIRIWQRNAARLALQWGTLDLPRTEVPRPTFRGKLGFNEVTDEVELCHDSTTKYQLKIISSMLLLLVLICVAVGAVILIFYGRIWLASTHLTNFQQMVVVGLANSLQIVVLDFGYKKVALALNRWENHRTDQAFKDSLILKVIIFSAMNNYNALLLVAFVKPFLGQGTAGACPAIDPGCDEELNVQVREDEDDKDQDDEDEDEDYDDDVVGVGGARLSRRQSSQLEDSSSFEDEEDDDDIRSVLSAPSLPVLARRLQDDSRACSSDIDDSSDDDEYGKSPSQQLKQQGARPEVHIV
eukprot:g955.t1